MAEYVFFFLKDRLESLWTLYQKENQLPARVKNSYQLGVLEGFQKHLSLLNQKDFVKDKIVNRNNLNALMILENENLSVFTRKKYPKISKQGSSKLQLFRDHYESGKIEGEKIVLSKAIHTNGNKNLRLKGNI